MAGREKALGNEGTGEGRSTLIRGGGKRHEERIRHGHFLGQISEKWV
jgi:hypothetical protein